MKKLLLMCSIAITANTLSAVGWKKADLNDENDLKQMHKLWNMRGHEQHKPKSSCWSWLCCVGQSSPRSNPSKFINYMNKFQKKYPFNLGVTYDVHENDINLLATPGFVGTYLFFSDNAPRGADALGVIQIRPEAHLIQCLEENEYELILDPIFSEKADLNFRIKAISVIKNKFDKEAKNTLIPCYINSEIVHSRDHITLNPVNNNNNVDSPPAPRVSNLDKSYFIDKMTAKQIKIRFLTITPDIDKNSVLDAGAFYKNGFMPSASQNVHLDDSKERECPVVQSLYYPQFPDDKAVGWSSKLIFDETSKPKIAPLAIPIDDQRTPEDMKEMHNALNIISSGTIGEFENAYKKYLSLCPESGPAPEFPFDSDREDFFGEDEDSPNSFWSLFSCFTCENNSDDDENSKLIKQ